MRQRSRENGGKFVSAMWLNWLLLLLVSVPMASRCAEAEDDARSRPRRFLLPVPVPGCLTLVHCLGTIVQIFPIRLNLNLPTLIKRYHGNKSVETTKIDTYDRTTKCYFCIFFAKSFAFFLDMVIVKTFKQLISHFQEINKMCLIDLGSYIENRSLSFTSQA